MSIALTAAGLAALCLAGCGTPAAPLPSPTATITATPTISATRIRKTIVAQFPTFTRKPTNTRRLIPTRQPTRKNTVTPIPPGGIADGWR